MKNLLFLDIETASLVGSMDNLLVVGYALDDGPVKVWDRHAVGETHQWRSVLADPAWSTVSHTPFDPRFLTEAGLEVRGPLIDTKVMPWVLNENTPLDLDWLAHRYAGIDMDKRLVRHSKRVFFRADNGVEYALDEWLSWQGGAAGAQFKDYCARDVYALRDLFNALLERMDEAEWTDYWLQEEVPYTRVLLDMEMRGLPVDLEATAVLAEEMERATEQVRLELLEEAGLPVGFNLNSQPQLVQYLFSRVCELKDVLVYDKETIECLKSCLDGEHEDCGDFFLKLPGHQPEDKASRSVLDAHVVDFLPEGFIINKLGRDRVHGHWTVKGRGLAATPPTLNKVTGVKGKLPSTSSPELLYLHASDDWVRKLCMEYRKTEKLCTTYLRKFPLIARADASERYPRIYGHYNQTGTVTGRLSSFDPNMQNMPARGARGKAVRSLFTGNLIIADYDQLEMRIMASLSEDERLLRVFREGGDPHEMLAHAIWGDDIDVHEVPPGAACSYRDAAKTLNYAMGYGAGRRKVAQTLSLLGWPTTPETAQGYLDEMKRFYRGLFRYKDKLIEKAHRRGYVTTLGGRKRRLRGAFKDTANWKAVGYGERQAVNSVIQGTAADIIRRAMIALARDLPVIPMLAQVHDELVFEYRMLYAQLMNGREGGPSEYLSAIKDIGENAHGFDLKVPLLFDPVVAQSWADKGGSSIAELFEEVDA